MSDTDTSQAAPFDQEAWSRVGHLIARVQTDYTFRQQFQDNPNQAIATANVPGLTALPKGTEMVTRERWICFELPGGITVCVDLDQIL
jgi:hypothetical protein